MLSFSHLHVHTEYSVLDGFGSAEAYAIRAKELGMKHLAITDHGTISGCLKFQKECDKQEINPIIGCELYIVPDASKKIKEKVGHITILCRNLVGWQELCHVLTYANLEGFYKKPRIDYETLLNSDLSGWIIMTACVSSFLTLKGGTETLCELQGRMQGRLYLEIMPHKEDIQKDFHKNVVIPMRKKTGLPLVATNDCHYVIRSDWKAQECLLAIQRGAKWDDPNRWRFSIKGLHLRSAQEMTNVFECQGQFSSEEIREAMSNTVVIAKECEDFRIPKQEISLPRAPKTTNENANVILDSLCWGVILNRQLDDSYKNRYRQEFKLIKKKGFAQYFLIVRDVIQYCDKSDIAVGPGRGSVGGSLIAFLLGITKIDPIKFELSFARFISEDRIDYPDIDIDFEDGKRDDVVQYIRDTYGENNVCGISTDARMKSRSVLWDVGRVFDIPRIDLSEITQTIQPQDHGSAVDTCFKNDPVGQRFFERYPEASRLAVKLENQLRHHGQHPAAVVVSADDLTNGKRTALKIQKGQVVSAWDMEDSEYNGLMKLDILGLSTLSVLAECKRLIQDIPLERFDFDDISLDDEEVFKQLSKGKTSGVFQFSARPTTDLCKEMKIDSFNDMVAAVALVRPGPYSSGMTGDYVRRKHGKKWKPKHEIYEKLTRDTFGILVFQEQVMQVISQVAGLSESTADQIRKVIGKKRDTKEFEPYHKQFLAGCKKQKTLSQKESNEFWKGLLEWAHYGFNKCVSGSTTLKRASKNHHHSEFSVSEIYAIRHNKDYAKKTGHLDLHHKLKFQKHYGYGMSLNKDGRIRKNIIKNIQPAGTRTVYRMILCNNSFIEVTDNHEIPTPDGNKKLFELRIGDSVFFCGDYEETKKNYNFSGKEQKVKGKKYGSHRGFPNGKRNPGYINGAYTEYIEFKKLSPNECTICGKKECRLETHHIDEDRNNNDFSNLQNLCVSCHKKQHYNNGRAKRGQKGYPAKLIRIESIYEIGKTDTWDVTMEKPYHNFVTGQNIVICNSHSVGYAMLGYWTCWLRIHYPNEFICACLTYSKKDEKQTLINEAQQNGLAIMLPKVDVSDAMRWTINDGLLCAPFIEINSMGEAQAKKYCKTSVEENVGFFNIKATPNTKTQMGRLLTEIGAYNLDEPPNDDQVEKHFSFTLSREIHSNISEVLGFAFPRDDLSNWKALSIPSNMLPPNFIRPVKRYQNKTVLDCDKCSLRKECVAPVLSSPGIFNVFITGEAPGFQEDQECRGFCEDAPAGKLLWKELALYGLTRQMFFVNNVCRCYPGKEIKTPKTLHVDTCKSWLKEEIIKIQPRLILAIGNTCVKAFTGQDGGIQRLSGETEWNEEAKAWICWCLHPAAVLRQGGNREYFEKGIRNFAKKFELLRRAKREGADDVPF